MNSEMLLIALGWWEDLAANKAPAEVFEAAARRLRNHGLDAQLVLLSLEDHPNTVACLGDTGDPEAAGSRIRCAQTALNQLREWAAREVFTTLATARAQFPLLARVCAQVDSASALLGGLCVRASGAGILLLDLRGPGADAEAAAAWGQRLRPPVRWLLERAHRTATETALPATLAFELSEISTLMKDMTVASASTSHPVGPPPTALDDAMRGHIEATLRRTGGRVSGPRGAARLLAINPNTLRARMRKLMIEPKRFAARNERRS